MFNCNTMRLISAIVIINSTILALCFASVNEENCEVCVKMLSKFSETLSADKKKNPESVATEFKAFCKEVTNSRDNRLCYYIGGLETSATNIIQEMAKPISWSMPTEKVCEKLKKLDGQICELKYEKVIDLKTVNFKTIKVKDLKKILDAWGENCNACTEKNEFVSLVKEKMKTYNPEAYAIHSKKEEL